MSAKHIEALRQILLVATPPSTITGNARMSKAARLSEIERIAREAVGE